MQIQNIEEVGYVYKRVKRGRGRKRFYFERIPAIRKPCSDGSVLLKPLLTDPPADPVPNAVTPAKCVTQAAKQKVPPAPKIPRNTNGSAQCSALIIGMRKHAYVGDKF